MASCIPAAILRRISTARWGRQSRFVQVEPSYAIQALELATLQVAYVFDPFAGTTLKGGATVLQPVTSYDVTLHDWPCNPEAGIALCEGKVNDSLFSFAPGWGDYLPGTLLCQAPEYKGPYRNALGSLCWTVRLRFDRRDAAPPTLNPILQFWDLDTLQPIPYTQPPQQGWNYNLNPQGDYQLATFRGKLASSTLPAVPPGGGPVVVTPFHIPQLVYKTADFTQIFAPQQVPEW